MMMRGALSRLRGGAFFCRQQRAGGALNTSVRGVMTTQSDRRASLKKALETMLLTPGPDMVTGRASCATVSIEKGEKVVIFGGRVSMDEVTSSTEILDVKTMLFTEGPPMITGRYGAAAVELDAKRVLVMGGCDTVGGLPLATTEILDLATMTFTQGPVMRTARSYAAAIQLGSKRVLICGGHSGAGEQLETHDSSEVLHVAELFFTPGPTMFSRRASHTALRIDENLILLAGGSFGAAGAVEGDEDDDDDQWIVEGGPRLSEVLCLDTMLFSPGPMMRKPRMGCTGVNLDPNRIWFVGGFNMEDEEEIERTSMATEIYDKTTHKFDIGPRLDEGRAFCGAAQLSSHRAIAFGGTDGFETKSNSFVLEADIAARARQGAAR